MPHYFPAKHVYWCLSSEHVVFLDLKRDKYMCLDREDSRTVTPLLRGSNPRAEVEQLDIGTSNDRIDAVIAALVRTDLLTTEENARERATPVGLTTPTEALISDLDTARPCITWKQMAAFCAAALTAHGRLRLRRIEQTVEWIRRRRADHHESGVFDLDRASHVVRTFNVLRPLLPRNYLCLFDSLALLEFLAKHELFPTWVFGVKADPFGAHCWVQQDNILLNDGPEYVRTFTPIMTA